ncbi:MAG: hypothetical protein U9R25_03905 [Chloroflexota bacterium]|nr:hypothetical protein [Chloroflexota bacterium]
MPNTPFVENQQIGSALPATQWVWRLYGAGLSKLSMSEQPLPAPERSMVALAGLKQLPHALQTMIDAVYPGKIIIFPALLDFPLTALTDLQYVLPQVYVKLGDGRTWTAEAEEAFLETMQTGGEEASD